MSKVKQMMWAACLGCAASVAAAQEDTQGRSLMEQGLRLFLEGLQDEVGPTLEGFQSMMDEIGPSVQGFLEEMGPKLGAVFSKVEDWSQYHAPEMLPNGDIILRKKSPSELETPKDDGGAVEL